MDLGIKGKVALITGSTKGIGRGIAEAFAAEGCHVGICARNSDEVDAAVKELSASGVKVAGGVVDVADPASLETWVSQCVAELGGVDFFVPNVSAGGADASEDGWRANFEADLLSTWRGVQLTQPHIEKSECGAIVVISSTAAIEAFAGATPYGAMKAALLNYAGNLAHDLAPKGIRVNSVSPGPIFIEGGAWDQIKEAMPEIYEGTVAAIPMGRMGSAQEVADQVVFLCSPRASFTTGTNVVLDGAFTKGLQF
ncbi:putative NAD-dependent 7alpha-hydroxysteroid dehydrogenase, dehydroxylation of bile acid [Luminiphilus syltensis NOR5-1B]|uniref:Putative NAD-dependent 7alpha-hydroxysteroid dehydrogenase, dehydroxylation of bile acid n=1 Tax=Luminiphilus syltensis NOR5-1B TaxID=565045 RepID=B8KSR5_9GAMM|nr:SDR family NAD(P)-dependent oxidoreductase [Luminiphilus syltensis]EED34959.1 putative NAD-dependent 7alpha-hydroxysteroid dehydrogenase, dehydroxylation of bile acid [Luminiphilus syltensis NOR5-1B]